MSDLVLYDHSLLCSAMGTLRSESGIQQGDPLEPLRFCLVLHKLVSTIAADSICSQLHSWYMMMGSLLGQGKHAALQYRYSIASNSLVFSLFINTSKCFSVEMTLELFLKRCENQIHCSTKPRVTHLQGCSREEYVHSVYERL